VFFILSSQPRPLLEECSDYRTGIRMIQIYSLLFSQVSDRSFKCPNRLAFVQLGDAADGYRFIRIQAADNPDTVASG
jgi:hypothetical protein